MSEAVRFTSSLLLVVSSGNEGVDEGASLPLVSHAFPGHRAQRYINIVHYLFQASLVLRCILPFSLDVQQVSV